MSANYTTTIDADVRDVLERSLMTADTLTLPAGQLDRALYVKVNKVLELSGGKWNRSAKLHKFSGDPRVALGLALDTGSVVDSKKQMQQFFTPSDLADHLVWLARVESGMTLLEPSAGGGAIVFAAIALGADVTAVELDNKLYDALVECCAAEMVMCSDFLTIDPLCFDDFDRVVMNPPFTKGQDIQHVTHALKFLKLNGLLVSVMGAGIKTNSTKAAVAFRQLVEDRGGYFVNLPAESFKESGTLVNTVAVIIPAGVA